MTIKVEVLPIEQGATVDPSNVNKHTAKGRKLVENSLQRRGAFRSIASAGKGDGTPVVYAGNLTLQTAVESGFKEIVNVHVRGDQLVNVVRDDVEPGSAEAIALGLEDNESGKQSYNPDIDILAALAAGDNAILSKLREEDKTFNWMLEGMGLKDETQDAEAQVDRADELLEKWGVKTGDLWRIGEHRLLCGDSTKREDVERLMGGEKAGAVVTDPPYGQNQKGVPGDNPENLTALLTGVVSTIPCENAVVIAFSSPRTFPAWLDITRQAGWKFERMLWLYKQAQEVYPWQGWLLTSEAILVSSIGKPEFHTPKPCNHDCYVLSEVSNQIQDGGDKEHPGPMWHGSIKPLSVVQSLTEHTIGIVYEPFAGSGTTLVACENLKRKGRGIEISPAYCAVILERISQAFPGIEIERIQNENSTL